MSSNIAVKEGQAIEIGGIAVLPPELSRPLLPATLPHPWHRALGPERVSLGSMTQGFDTMLE